MSAVKSAFGGHQWYFASQFLDSDNRAHRGKAKIMILMNGICHPSLNGCAGEPIIAL